MTKRTHLVFAALATSLILQPIDLKSSLIIYGASSIGSILPDIDVSSSTSHKDITIISIISFIIIIGMLIIDYYFNLGIIEKIRSNNNCVVSLIGLSLLLLTCAHGLHTPHRTFMHSIPVAILLSSLVYLIYNAACIPFFIGIITHIILDIFNRKRIQLFYPIKFKFCLDICDSNGKVNDIICILSIILLIILK